MPSFLRKLHTARANHKDRSLDGIVYPHDVYQYGFAFFSMLYGERAEDVEDNNSDLRSLLSESTNFTVDNNVGTGRTIDNWIYQPGGRLLEKIAARITPVRTRANCNLEERELSSDDTRSVSSFSSTATADNLPGTGRTVDTWFYQPAGRWVERSAARVAVRFDTISPLVIARRVMEMGGGSKGFESVNHELPPFSQVTESISTAIVAGLESLVRQARSKSSHRSASALSSLILLSSCRNDYLNFTSRSLTIGSGEDGIMNPAFITAKNSSLSHYNLFFNLARITLTYLPNIEPTFDFAQQLRSSLIELLEIFSSGQYELFDLVGQACELLRTCHSCIVLSPWDRMHCDAKVDVMEATFHILVFTTKLLCILRQRVRSVEASAESQWYTLLFTTYVQWVDNVMFVVFFYLWSWQAFCPALYGLEVSLYNILFVFEEVRLLLPYSFSQISHFDNYPLDTDNYPRNAMGHTATASMGRAKRWIIRQARIRTVLFLHDLDKLRDEVECCWYRTDKGIREGKIKETDWFKWEKKLFKSLEGARSAQCREAEEIFLKETLEDQLTWNDHMNLVRARHAWGQYVRSDLDWKWDPSVSLRQLFYL